MKKEEAFADRALEETASQRERAVRTCEPRPCYKIRAGFRSRGAVPIVARLTANEPNRLRLLVPLVTHDAVDAVLLRRRALDGPMWDAAARQDCHGVRGKQLDFFLRQLVQFLDADSNVRFG